MLSNSLGVLIKLVDSTYMHVCMDGFIYLFWEHILFFYLFYLLSGVR